MSSDRHRRRAGTLLLVTSALWVEEWLPALLVAAWVSWLVLHERLEGHLGEAIIRRWQRDWPPRAVPLVALLATSTLAYWVYAPLPGKILPIALNLLGVSMIFLGNSWQAIVRPGRIGSAMAGTQGGAISTRPVLPSGADGVVSGATETPR